VPATVSVDRWLVGEAVTAVRYQITDTPSPIVPTLSVLTFLSLTALETPLVFSVGLHQQAVGSVILREFVSQCDASEVTTLWRYTNLFIIIIIIIMQ